MVRDKKKILKTKNDLKISNNYIKIKAKNYKINIISIRIQGQIWGGRCLGAEALTVSGVPKDEIIFFFIWSYKNNFLKL